MIPKTIHYCWFGKQPLPELAIKCIDSWKKYLPDYEIVEWNEDNFDVNEIPYTEQAYSKGKFAFVSDYARYKILLEHGGLYFDTDVEIIKPIDDIISLGPFLAIESPGNVATGLGMGSIKYSPLIKNFLDEYSGVDFILDNGKLNQRTIVDYTSIVLRKNGLTNEDKLQRIEGFNIYPKAYFNPMDYTTKEIVLKKETRCIHHYAGSWCEPPSVSIKLKSVIATLIGKRLLRIVRNFTHRNDKYWNKQ